MSINDSFDNDFAYDKIDNYGTPDSPLLKEVREAGFKPIGITVLMCEETFIFKTHKEAELAGDKFLPEGWWYSFSDWVKTREEYVKENYRGDEDLAPTIYWFDKNYEPKTK